MIIFFRVLAHLGPQIKPCEVLCEVLGIKIRYKGCVEFITEENGKYSKYSKMKILVFKYLKKKREKIRPFSDLESSKLNVVVMRESWNLPPSLPQSVLMVSK